MASTETTARAAAAAAMAAASASEVPAAALLAGYIATACFIIQYIPQAILNYRRKSVSGFSTSGILIKLIGACYLCVNAWLLGEELPVILYGCVNIFQHSFFLVQFYLYTGRKHYVAWLLFPLIPLLIGEYYPESIQYTSMVKPITQILSHLPQLWVTYTKQTSDGVSLSGQHLNLIGGFLGLYMYNIVPPKSFWTYTVYLNSLFQAISLYAMAVYYDGWGRLLNSLPFVGSSAASAAASKPGAQTHIVMSPSAEAVKAGQSIIELALTERKKSSNNLLAMQAPSAATALAHAVSKAADAVANAATNAVATAAERVSAVTGGDKGDQLDRDIRTAEAGEAKGGSSLVKAE